MPPDTPSLSKGFDHLHRLQDAAIEAAKASSPPRFHGSGIVIVAGGPRYFTNAWVALTCLRDVVGTTLPIQIWHLGPDELTGEMRHLVSRFDVEVVDAYDVANRSRVRHPGGWECKPFAIRHTPYRHVILLDADNVPLTDPAELLDTPQYRATGAIFWPDNQSHPKESPVWELFRVAYRQELEVESGQLVVDKERCWLPLNLAQHFNEHSDAYYRFVYGDKETFHFAWRQLGQPYAMPAGRPTIVHCHWETPQGRKRMTAALEQRDFEGRTIFHHRTGAEWSLLGDNPSTGRPELDEVCRAALADLRTKWDGRMRRIEPRAKLAMSGASAAAQHCLLRRVGVEERTITLLPNGSIGTGATIDCRWWRVADGHRISSLTFGGDDGATCHLTRDRDGIWRGRELWFQRVPVELVPL